MIFEFDLYDIGENLAISGSCFQCLSPGTIKTCRNGMDNVRSRLLLEE